MTRGSRGGLLREGRELADYPGRDRAMKDKEYAIMNTHSWESGMMHVHPEDVEHIAKTRVVECGNCEDVHPSTRPCPWASNDTLELWGFPPFKCSDCGGGGSECRGGCDYLD